MSNYQDPHPSPVEGGNEPNRCLPTAKETTQEED